MSDRKSDKPERSVVRHFTGIDSHVEQALGDALRNAFSFITQEPVPDRFLQLVEDLTRKKN